MEQLVININNMKKTFLNKEVLEIDELKVYENEKIGIIGANGSGKSTLLKLMTGELKPDSGEIETHIDFRYYAQMKEELTPDYTAIDAELLSRLNIPEHESHSFSGGEQTRLRLAEFFTAYHFGLLMDEPTTHLDAAGIQFLVDQLKYYYGTLLVVSHDRYFLDEVVDTIWEVANGQVQVYKGNYAAYQEQKELEKMAADHAYESFMKEKSRLEQAARKKKAAANQMSQVSAKQKNRSVNPGRLDSSKQKDTVQKAAHKAAKSMEKRAKQLEKVEKITEARPIHFPQPKTLEMHNPFPIMGEDVTIKRGDKLLLDKVSFQFPLGKRIGIVGPNGCGKSTLLQHIVSDGEGITLSKKIVFSIYQQMDYQLKADDTMVDYLMQESDYEEALVRSVLNQLGFDQAETSNKALSDLSGGEATRLVIAKLFTDPSNVLILDEPTNFIDLQTIEALESLMLHYPGTILFTSHDQYFMKNAAQQIWAVEDRQLKLVKD